MNKEYQEERLRHFLMDSSLKSGLYLIDTDLSDGDIEAVMRKTGNSLYEKILVPAVGGSTFEMFVAGLSYKCNNPEIDEQREQWLRAIVNGRERDVLLFNLVIRIMKCLCTKERTVLHLQSEKDITSFSHNELSTLQTSLAYHPVTTVIINKEQNGKVIGCDGIINRLSIKENIAYRTMDRLSKVHISYKHDPDHDEAVELIIRGLKNNSIAFSIDADGIKYRDNIVEYEKEIGESERVIIFVIDEYLKSLDCMYEMVQMFKMGNVEVRLFPVVDLKGIPRNGDGLNAVKEYWTNEKIRKLEQMKSEGNSDFMQDETRKINDIIQYIDKFWDFLVHINTGNYEKMMENDAALLMEELKKTLPKYEASFSSKFVPSGSTEPTPSRTIIQNGANSIYVENHNGPIILESVMPKRNRFSTEIRYAFDKPYIKVFFYDDTDVTVAKGAISTLKSVMRVNVTESQGAAHPGNTLTVYPKPMVSAEECETDVKGALNGYFACGVVEEKKPVRNDAYFNGIADKIIKDLDKARVSIHVCIAWFTNQSIADKLVEKYKQGVDVKVIYFNDHTNSKFGVNIDKIPFKAVRGSRGGIMHNKYCIIDNQIVITGSYNWSDNAENKNDENAVAMYDYDNASDFTVEFKKMFGSE